MSTEARITLIAGMILAVVLGVVQVIVSVLR